MPSSGYGCVDLFTGSQAERQQQTFRLIERMEWANKHHMFVEWLESFVAAWEETHDVDIASMAGLDEWDL